MNYFQMHIGDYAASTLHLSLIEDAIYMRLLRRYYLDEKPLPPDIKQVARIAGARSDNEVSAVEVILLEFFYLCDEGWRNKRADEEIAIYREKSSKAKQAAIASVNARSANAQRTLNERSANAQPTNNQEPVTNNQEPVKRVEAKQQRGSRLPSDWKPSDEDLQFCKTERPELNPRTTADGFRDYWLAQPGAKGLKLDWSATWRNWVRRSLPSVQTIPAQNAMAGVI